MGNVVYNCCENAINVCCNARETRHSSILRILCHVKRIKRWTTPKWAYSPIYADACCVFSSLLLRKNNEFVHIGSQISVNYVHAAAMMIRLASAKEQSAYIVFFFVIIFSVRLFISLLLYIQLGNNVNDYRLRSIFFFYFIQHRSRFTFNGVHTLHMLCSFEWHSGGSWRLFRVPMIAHIVFFSSLRLLLFTFKWFFCHSIEIKPMQTQRARYFQSIWDLRHSTQWVIVCVFYRPQYATNILG